MKLRRVVIAGLGLIGGSFAKALREADIVDWVVGIGRRPDSLAVALQAGIIDEEATDWQQALKGADLVLLAMPVGQIAAVMKAMAPYLEAETLVTDVGSTKAEVIGAAYAYLDQHLSHVVPGHPIAGREQSGIHAAQSDLFRSKKVVLTPLPENEPAAILKVRKVWERCGALITEMLPQDHDRVFAAVSHLPHLLAFGLVHDLSQRENAEQLFDFAASGFRDFTRIAGSHPEMWRDICIGNRQQLLAELDQYLAELAYLRALLLSSDGERLERYLSLASSARQAWAAHQLPLKDEQDEG